MSSALAPLSQLLGCLVKMLAALMFACVFGVFCFKIVMRYAAGDAVAWADEVSVVLFVWIILWANAFIVSDNDQITFDLVYRGLSPGARRIMKILRHVLIGGIFLAALPGVIDYILFLWRERTPVLGLRLDFVYACFAFFVIAVIARALGGMIGLFGRHWQEKV